MAATAERPPLTLTRPTLKIISDLKYFLVILGMIGCMFGTAFMVLMSPPHFTPDDDEVGAAGRGANAYVRTAHEATAAAHRTPSAASTAPSSQRTG